MNDKKKMNREEWKAWAMALKPGDRVILKVWDGVKVAIVKNGSPPKSVYSCSHPPLDAEQVSGEYNEQSPPSPPSALPVQLDWPGRALALGQ